MNLTNFGLPDRAGQVYKHFGTDSPKCCHDKKFFKQFPHSISYTFNSRGFRDREWPKDLESAIWCIGDSQTLGIGSPVEHTWPYLLEQAVSNRTINVSMEGASNEWIARKACQVLDEIRPSLLIIQWSFIHRSENPDTTLNDEDRRMFVDYRGDLTEERFFKNFQKCHAQVENHRANCQVIHSFVPFAFIWSGRKWINDKWAEIRGQDWSANPPVVLADIPADVVSELHTMRIYDDFAEFFEADSKINKIMSKSNYICDLDRIDYARDHFHMGVKTAELLVKHIQQFLPKN